LVDKEALSIVIQKSRKNHAASFQYLKKAQRRKTLKFNINQLLVFALRSKISGCKRPKNQILLML
jgi:hypothetical protein